MTGHDRTVLAQEAEALAGHLLDFARDLKNPSEAGEISRWVWPAGQSGFIETLDAIMRARRLRTRHFDSTLFGEPAWDMMLLLFKAHLWGTDMSVPAICQAAGPHEAAGRRWIAVLVRLGLAETCGADADGGEHCLRLTEQGAFAMTRSLIDTRTALADTGRRVTVAD